MLPIDISFKDWAQGLVLDFPHLPMPIPPEEDKWQEWAMMLKDINQFADIPHPIQGDFKTWNEWAQRFVQTAYN